MTSCNAKKPFPYYILTEDKEVQQVDFETYAAWENAGGVRARCVRRTEVGDAYVSTVFLMIDHRFGDAGPPVVFETMVFGGAYDQHQDRYTTYYDAVYGHQQVVNRVLESQAWLTRIVFKIRRALSRV